VSLAGRAAPARADRIQAFDVARGSAMLLVFLSHFSLRYLKVASGLRWHAAQGWVTLGATPAFVLVSGMMLGLLRTARADFTRMRDKLIDRGLFLLIVARPLIAIAHIALVKDWQQAFIDIVYITDTVGVSLILGALIAERVGDWGRLWLGLAVLATSWTANIAWSPDFPGGQLVEELLFGRLQGDSLLSNFPLLPWFGWYLIGSGVGALVVRAHADGAGRAAARVLFRAAAVSAVVAAIAKAAESPLRLASSDLMTAVGRTASLMSVREKLPPGVTYLALYGALSALGVACTDEGGRTILVSGAGGAFPVKRAELFLGNAGTAFRPMTAVLALCGGEYRLSGVARMHERPIRDLVDALRGIGADIEYLGREGYPPLAVHPGAVRAGADAAVRGNVSSQYLTGLLIALPLTGARTLVRVEGELISRPYVDITVNTVRRFGVEIERRDYAQFVIPAGARLASPGEIHVEGDASSASYFLAAGAISGLAGGGPVRVEGVGRASIQGDVRFTEILTRMGARIEMGENWIEATAGGEAAARRRLAAIDADFNLIPDAAMTAAVAALFAQGTSTLRNIGSWRVKETDRIAAMATELRKLGAAVEEGPDSLRITPPDGSRLTANASIDTYDDHRMAMSFSLAALGGVPVRINDPRCVAKTFPDYFQALAGISEH